MVVFYYCHNIYFGVWRSLVAHLLWEQGVVGSNPFTPTKYFSLGCSCNDIYIMNYIIDVVGL